MSKQVKWIVGICLGVVALFCSSFIFFYTRAQQRLQPPDPTVAKSAFGNPLPEVHLVDSSGAKVDDQILRKGKVVIIFVTPDCRACHVESDFLRTAVNRRSDVSFYGIISFGKKLSSSEDEKLFPFKVFYDDDFSLAPKLGINRVPIKIYLEDGVMKKAWGGATTDEEKKAAFIQWLDSV